MTDVNNVLLDKMKKLAELRKKNTELGKELDESKKKHTVLEAEIWNDLEAAGVTSVRVDDVGLMTRRTKVKANVLVANIPEAKKWFEEQGIAEELIRERVDGSRLNSVISELVKTNKPVPECISWIPHQTIGITNKK